MEDIVEHARIELERIGEDPRTIQGILNVIQAFKDMNHSGASAMATIPVIVDLLNWKNLAPLTDDPDEWFYFDEKTWGRNGGVWQNKRYPAAFSDDDRKTYWDVNEKPQIVWFTKKTVFHKTVSVPK